GLDAVVSEIEAAGARALAIPVDVASAQDVFEAAERVERELGPIDVWVNNAMTTIFGPVDQVTPDEFARVIDVTFLGCVWGTQAALRAMKPRNRGVIVQVGSALAYRGIPLQAAYCAAKHAERGFTDSLRSELAHDKIDIHLTMVQLPAINTPQHIWCENKLDKVPQPVPPIFAPEIAADAIYFAATHRRREIWLGWPTIKTILGQTFVPGYVDYRLANDGYSGQFTNDDKDPAQPSNLFAPVEDRDYGPYGDMANRARKSDLVAQVSTWLGAGGVTAVIGGALAATAFVVSKLRR
ncbi:MAG TPA: SDR family oxidoreductase, partial [Kofleriaceae bacterium]|nr:SDR family oxidoreductase [Kofleriaceae bacterium]